MCVGNCRGTWHVPERHFPPAQHPETEPAGEKPQGRKDDLLFVAGFSCADDYCTGVGSY